MEAGDQRPRWAYTPAAMVAPVRSRLPRRESPWAVNEDPKLLDAFYVRLFGDGGDQLLTDETKWLAVTHKSYDHGRRGFNDRLSYFGKRIIELQMTLALLGSPARNAYIVNEDPHGRQPYEHPATEGMEVLNGGARAHLLQPKQIAGLGRQYGIEKVIRWNPRNPENMKHSGADMVLTQAIFAIAGAVALERGGGEAHQLVRERIIRPLGVQAKVIQASNKPTLL